MSFESLPGLYRYIQVMSKSAAPVKCLRGTIQPVRPDQAEPDARKISIKRSPSAQQAHTHTRTHSQRQRGLLAAAAAAAAAVASTHVDHLVQGRATTTSAV